MTVKPKREAITARTESSALPNPLDGVAGLSGVRVHHVGQGDALSLLDSDQQLVLRVDYGGKQSSPFPSDHGREAKINAALPIHGGRHLFLSHWDEDHWCSAREGTAVLKQARWLVPRQLTSPRAVLRSTQVSTIHCIPETLVGKAVKFEAARGDAFWLEKLGKFDADAGSEDCNLTGLAFAATSLAREVILMPGDAPFHRVQHYWYLKASGYRLRGLLAFHHGAKTHWTSDTDELLRDWPPSDNGQMVAFSYGNPNKYEHPHLERYRELLPQAGFLGSPLSRDGYVDLLFV